MAAVLAAAVAAMTAAATVTGCTGSSGGQPHTDSVSGVIRSLGAVPIPSAGPAEATPTAHPGHPAVLAIGGPVRATLAGKHTAVVTALGPQQANTAPSGPAADTRAVITLRLAALTGTTTIAADELSSRDETGRLLKLTAIGARTRTIHPGQAASIKVSGTFDSGAAQVTWRHDKQVIAIWTFNIELD